ncbi:hypothetical protein D3C71_2097120 [compost metagenome]
MPEGLSMAAVSVSSDTAGAGLFLEVIVRHVPGLMGSEVRCHLAIAQRRSRRYGAAVSPAIGG